jgi:murein DD-endopeptidase MepM/ murein hydrolase activator NlpD
MAFTTTRDRRADRRRPMSSLLVATFAITTLSLFLSAGSMAQVKAPAKSQFRHQPTKAAPKSPTDTEADQLNEKWLSEFNKAEKPAPTPDKAAAPDKSLATSTSPAASPAPQQPADDERRSSVPSMVALPGAGARTVVAGTTQIVKVNSMAAAFKAMPGGADQPTFKDLTQAFAGFTAAGSAKVEMVQGRTADGTTRLLYASIGDGKSKQSYWWFTPLDQPEGWFDENGKRLGGTALGEPKPDSRISSPFGRRTYYGRTTSAAFHNGIDYEGKPGEAILAAGDGVVNHAGWYFNYGRTVKISHADNFETLYAHMSRFAPGLTPGMHIHKGDIIGYVGSTGRSTGPHLHFSVIVDGQFVDPAPYISQNGGQSVLVGQSLVAFRKWQQDVHKASDSKRTTSDSKRFPNLQGGDSWSQNPFNSPDRRL